MNNIFGYCRISRKTQNIERQVKNISTAYPDAIIYSEAYTGTKVNGRKEFSRLLKRCRKDDTIVFDSVSRMSRNAEEGITLYFKLYDKGVNLIFLKEPCINTSVYRDSAKQTLNSTGNEIADLYIEATNKMIRLLAKKQIEKAFEQAEKEVLDLQKRTQEGLFEDKRKGKQIGGIKGSTYNVSKKEPAKTAIRKYSKYFNGTLSDKDTMKLIGISRNTFYRYKKELLVELGTR